MKIHKIADNSYSAEVPVEIWFSRNASAQLNGRSTSDFDINHDKKAFVNFDIDIEAREWGIKGISVFPRHIGDIRVSITEFTNDEDRVVREGVVRIDPLKLQTEKNSEKNFIGIESIELYIMPDLTVDYSQSLVTLNEI